MSQPLMWPNEIATYSSNIPDIPGGIEPWAVDRWLNAGSVVMCVDFRDLCTIECAAKQQQSGVLYVHSAGQELPPNRATDMEERVRQIAEKASAESSVQLRSI